MKKGHAGGLVDSGGRKWARRWLGLPNPEAKEDAAPLPPQMLGAAQDAGPAAPLPPQMLGASLQPQGTGPGRRVMEEPGPWVGPWVCPCLGTISPGARSHLC